MSSTFAQDSSTANPVDAIVVDAIASWARRRMGAQKVPRSNVLLRFGSPELARAVASALRPDTCANAWYLVRASSDPDAVRCRHGRPADLVPHGVLPSTPVLYLCLWSEGADGHSSNAQSLADLRGIELRTFLSDSANFIWASEQAILDQALVAAAAFDKKAPQVAAHLRSAFDALRMTLREKFGGRERSFPYVTSLDRYAEFLRRARVDAASLTELPAAARAESYVAAWGRALPALGLFRVPELPSLLPSLPLRPDDSVPKKDQGDAWLRSLDGLLAENLDAAVDHEALAEAVAGNETVEAQLARLGERIPLHRTEPKKAASALLGFLRSGEETAFERVDWVFRKEPGNNRSETHGLKGLLSARRAGRRRTTAVDAALDASIDALRSTGSTKEQLDLFIDRSRAALTAVSQRRGVADALAALFAALERVTEPPGTGEWTDVVKSTLGQERADALKARGAAAAWLRLANKPDEPSVEAPTLLLGLARLFAALLRAKAADPVTIENAGAGSVLVLRVAPAPGSKTVELEVAPEHLDAAVFDQMRVWLRDQVLPAQIRDEPSSGDETGDLDEVGEQGETQSEDAPTIEVIARRSGSDKLLGEIVLPWSEEARELVKATRTDVARAWCGEPTVGRAHSWQARRAFLLPGNPLPLVTADVAQPIAELDQAIGPRDAASDIAFLLAPTGARAREFARAWDAALGTIGDDQLASMQAERDQAIEQEDFGRVKLLTAEIKKLATSPKRPTAPQVAALLQAFTGTLPGSREPAPSALALAPLHPLVLRFRAIADDILASVIGHVWLRGWPTRGLEDLDEFVWDYGLPKPVHTYGGFWDGEPLVFDGWRDDGRSALFVRRSDAIGSDLSMLGIRRAVDEIRRYIRLYPAAADRLRVRIHGDPELDWARNLARALAEEPRLATDIDVVVPDSTESAARLERWTEETERLAEALVLSEDGVRPRIRVRLTNERTVEAHIALLVAPTQAEFQGHLDRVKAPTLADEDLFDATPMFARRVPVAVGQALVIGAPAAGPELRIARAVAFASKGADDPWVERYGFHPSTMKAPLEALHAKSHWMILVGREPLERAFDAVGHDVVVLLDHGESRDRGRPLHHATSVGHAQLGGDLARLRALLAAVLDDEAAKDAQALLIAARRLAPGLAIQCLAAGSRASFHGLLGLLLTATWIERDGTAKLQGGVALALDQCRSILGQGDSERRADILVLRFREGRIELALVESKLTTGSLAAGDGVVAEARLQIAETLPRLARLGAEHPLARMPRADLAAALRRQGSAGTEIVRALEDSTTPITLADAIACRVCLFAPRDEGTHVFPDLAGAAPVSGFARGQVLTLWGDLVRNARAVGT